VEKNHTVSDNAQRNMRLVDIHAGNNAILVLALHAHKESKSFVLVGRLSSKASNVVINLQAVDKSET